MMIRKLIRSLVVMAAAALIPAARYAFGGRPTNCSREEVVTYLLAGGPFDGRKEEDWVGSEQIHMSMAAFANDAESARGWALYHRSQPETWSDDGLIIFQFVGIRQEYLG
jgi:hypothetical protein